MEKQQGPKNHIRIGMNTRVGRVVSYVNELIKTENPSTILFSAIGSSIGTLVNVVEAVKIVNAKEFYQINKISSVSTNSVDSETNEKHVERLSPKMDITLTLDKPTSEEFYQDKLSEESRLQLFNALNNRVRRGNNNRGGRGFGRGFNRGRGRGFNRGGRGNGNRGFVRGSVRGRGNGNQFRGGRGNFRGFSRGRVLRGSEFGGNNRGNRRDESNNNGRFRGRGFGNDRGRDFNPIPRGRGNNRGYGFRDGSTFNNNNSMRDERSYRGGFGQSSRGQQMFNRGRGFNPRGGMQNGPFRRGGY